MKYHGHELVGIRIIEPYIFRNRIPKLVWNDTFSEPKLLPVWAVIPGRINPVITEEGAYEHYANVPKIKTNWDEYCERMDIQTCSLDQAKDLIKSVPFMACYLCPAYKWCKNNHFDLANCIGMFRKWAESEYKD